ncbi:MAG: histidine kinase [Bacteroidales bacterium]
MKLPKPELIYFRIPFLVILACLFLVHVGVAQHLGYKRFTVDDGLAQSEVVAMFQDSRGFIWVGTKFGVSKFDGNSFITRFDSLGILKAAVRNIKELADGSVIATSALGYVIFETNGNIIAYKYPSLSTNPSYIPWTAGGKAFVLYRNNQEIHFLEASKHGPVNMDTNYKGLLSFLKKLKFKDLIFDEKYNCFYIFDSVYRMNSYVNGKLTKLAIHGPVQYIKGRDGYIYAILNKQNPNQNKKLFSNPAFASLYAHYGLINEIYRLEGLKYTKLDFEFHSKDPLVSPMIAVDKAGKIIIVDQASDRVHFYSSGNETSSKLTFYGLSSLMADEEGTLWLGTANGLMQVFPEYFTNYSEQEGLFPDIQSLQTDQNGTLWAGSYESGLQYYKNGRFVKQDISEVKNSKIRLYFYPGSRTDHHGSIHFPVSPFFSMKWDGSKLDIDRKWPMAATFYFFDDSIFKRHYYGSDLGLVVKNYGETTFKIHPIFIGSNSGRIVSIIRTSNHELFLGGFKALTIYDAENSLNFTNPKHPDIPGANTMEMDYKGNVWIGNSNGLYFYDNKFFHKIENEYFNDLILSLQSIDSTKLLIGGIKGIGVLDLVEFYKNGDIRILYFDKNNGFIGGECQQNCIALDKQGNCWIGASNGIVKLDVNSMPTNNSAVRVYLSHVYTNNVKFDWYPIPNNEFGKGEVDLVHNNNNIRFEYTGICFSAPGKIKFSYKLEGFDDYWSVPSPDRDVTYTNLPPGNYVFKVKACKVAGVWSEEIAEFKVVVHAAFWQMWYFYVLVLVFFAGLITVGVFLFLSRRTRILNQRNEVDRRFAELQFKTLRNQLEPHFVFNALNAIGSSIYQNDKEKSYDFLQRFAILIRATLLHADKTYRTLKEEIDFVKNYLDLEQFRFENKFQYEIKIEEGILLETLVPKMIIQTFAENAVKHGLVQKNGKGILSIAISSNEGFMLISIEDNGIGRTEALKRETSSTGMGLAIIKEYIALFNRFNENKIFLLISDKRDGYGKISGTLVTIKLPNNFTFNSIT